jgi:adenylate cyclase
VCAGTTVWASRSVGGNWRLDTGVVGDAVNTSARIESLTKRYGEPILVSEDTAGACGDAFSFRTVDRVAPKGKSRQITLYALAKGQPATG